MVVRGPARLKMSFHKVWKHLRGEGNQEGRVWGGITVSGGCWGIHGQSCLALDHSTVREAKPSSGWGGPWLNVCLNPLTSFQSKPFARAYRISAWSHGRAQLPLGKADTTQWLSEAELNRPRSPPQLDEGCAETRLTQYPFGQGGSRAAPGTEQNMSEIPTVPTVYLVLLIHSMEWWGSTGCWEHKHVRDGMMWTVQNKTMEHFN